MTVCSERVEYFACGGDSLVRRCHPISSEDEPLTILFFHGIDLEVLDS